MNNGLTDVVITALGYLTILGQILIPVLIILLFVSPKKKNKLSQMALYVKENALTLIFIIASVATLGSLFLSEVASFVPCKLCWWQRIFMYPTAVISFIALLRNDKKSAFYILPLGIIGGTIAAYHYVMQLFPNLLECSEEVAKCSTIQFAQYGYITIPVMALTAFLLIAISSLYLLKK